MIQKIIKARSVADTLAYVLSSRDSAGRLRPRVDIVETSFAGRDQFEIAREFSAICGLRPNLKRGVWHSVLRLAPDDRPLSDDEWRLIVRRYAETLGFEDLVAICHGDHVHLVCPRVRSDGTVVTESFDYLRGEKVVRQIEIDFELVRIQPSHLCSPEIDYTEMKSPYAVDYSKSDKNHVIQPVYVVQQAVLEALRDQLDVGLEEFEQHLSRRKVKLIRRASRRDGRIQLAFVFDGKTYGPRALGGLFSAEGLSRVGLNLMPPTALEVTVAAHSTTSELAFQSAEKTVNNRVVQELEAQDSAVSEAQEFEVQAPDQDFKDESFETSSFRPF